MIRLFSVYVPASTLVLLAFETAVIISAFCLSVYVLGDLEPADYLVTNPWVSVALVSISFIAAAYFQDLYSQVRVKSRLLLAQQLLMVAGATFLVQALISALAPDLYLPFRVILLGSTVSIAVMFVSRLLFSVYVLPKVAGDRLLLVGDGPMLDDLADYLELHPQLGIHVAGRVRETSSSAPPLDLTGMMQTYESNGIVVAMPGSRLASELLELRFLGFSIQEAAGTYAKICNRESLVGLTPTRLLSSGEFEPATRSLFFKAVVDKLVAAAGLVVLSPLMLLLAVLVRLCFHGTVFERRIRGGRNGAPFTLYRFRVSSTEDVSSGARQTWLGRLLSRTGLYALPQLFNVLCGQMSLVGPKPHAPEFIRVLTGYIPIYPQRFKVTPGMTGWSQIQMRHDSGPPDCMVELEYDLYYIKQAAPMMNIFVILQSIKNILLWGGRP